MMALGNHGSSSKKIKIRKRKNKGNLLSQPNFDDSRNSPAMNMGSLSTHNISRLNNSKSPMQITLNLSKKKIGALKKSPSDLERLRKSQMKPNS